MYNENNLVHIFTILEAIEKINIYTLDFQDDEEFYVANNQLHFNAVVNLLIAIGEENKKIDDTIKNDFPFHWKEISKMRDKISHNYRGISPFAVWDIVKNSLNEYKNLLLTILPKVDNVEEVLEDALQSTFYKNLQYLKNII